MIPKAPDLPGLSAEQMRAVDRIMIEELGIDLVRMMESAGLGLADLARRRWLGGSSTGKEVLILAGKGGNGGGALVAARRLHGWGARCRVILGAPREELAPVPRQQLQILEGLGLGIGAPAEPFPKNSDLILDGLLGYSQQGPPREPLARLIRAANNHPAPILALDLPSGLDASSGKPSKPAIRAAATLTLALPKRGLLEPCAAPFVGELYLADLGVPAQVYRALGWPVGALFAESSLLKL